MSSSDPNWSVANRVETTGSLTGSGNVLTDARIRRLAPLGKAKKYTDGRGLYLYVRPSGVKSWRYDYRLKGLRKSVTFGLYPDVTLAMARRRLQVARTQVADGIDPSAVKQTERREANARQSFAVVALEWLKKQPFAPATLKKTTWILETLIGPTLGRQAIGTIEPPDVLTMLQAIEKRGTHELAHRARQLCGQVLRYAVATGRATRDATADLRGALAPVVTENHAAITAPDKVGKLLRAIDRYQGAPKVKAALQLLALVFVRPGELRHAEWSEIDLSQKLWRIPARKMKMRDDHLVPLSTQAVAILSGLPRPTRGRYVFPSRSIRSKTLSNNTLNKALHRLGYPSSVMTPHGFRAMARTLLDERLRVNPDVIEVQLAHVVRGPLGATYNRSRYLEERTKMMQTWADELDRLRLG